MSDERSTDDFHSQVHRLVAEGKLTPEEAQGLLGRPEDSAPADQDVIYTAPANGQTPPDLRLEVHGFTLQVILDAAQLRPQLHVSEDGAVLLEAAPEGWRVARRPERHHPLHNVRAVLTLPFAPRHTRAEVHGGGLSLPDLSGELLAEVHGGNLKAGQARSLRAEVHGGNLSATEIGGPAHINVHGGNLSLTGAQSLNASVHGGNLKWAGQLSGGDHRVEVHAGNATLHLLPGSSVRVAAEVTVGAFKADFPTQKAGGFVNTRHSGQLGAGEATLSCRVAAGQIKLVSA